MGATVGAALPYMSSGIKIISYMLQIFHIGKYGGPGGTRTRGFFSAMDKFIGEKGEIAVYNVYYVPKSPYCSSISVPELLPQHEASKGTPKPCTEGEKGKNRFHKLVMIGATQTLIQLIKSRETGVPWKIYSS